MVEIGRKWGERLLDGVFPIECFACGEYGSWWCKACQDRVVLLDRRTCVGCNRTSAHGETCFECLRAGYPLDGLLAASAYEDALIKQAIGYYKYHSVKELAVPLGALLAHVFQASRLTDEWWYGVPVPLHPRRERMRGFNQSDQLAVVFESHTGITRTAIMRRIRSTHPQMDLSAKERRANMERDVFAVTDPALVYGKNILLIDDVATTGSTLAACARVLKAAGAARIWGLVVAHG